MNQADREFFENLIKERESTQEMQALVQGQQDMNVVLAQIQCGCKFKNARIEKLEQKQSATNTRQDVIEKEQLQLKTRVNLYMSFATGIGVAIGTIIGWLISIFSISGGGR